MDKDIEELLAEPEEKKDLKEEQPAGQEKSPDEKADETGTENEKKLKKELKRRQAEIDRLKAEKEKPKEEVKAEADDKLKTQEDWLKHIDDTAEKKAEEKLKPLKEANLNRAVREFVKRHPEYVAPENKSKLKECVDAASGKLNEDDILESMSRTWASQNYRELEKEASRRESARGNSQKSAIKAAATGEGIRDVDDFTEEETRKAEKLGMGVEEYRKALRGYRANSVNATN